METMMSNGFERTLRDVRQGHTVSELSEKLQELVAGVRLTGRGGELVLRLRVKPASRGDTTTLMVEDEVQLRMPKTERMQTVFFADDGNGLLRNDPRQKEFPELKAIDGGKVDPERLRQVNG